MAKIKYDGVVEAVHYKPNGEVDWVRAYERRGPIFSDHVLIERSALVDRLKSGLNYVVGSRLPLKAGTFDVSVPLNVIDVGGKETLVVGETQAEKDRLDGVPII